MNVCSGRRETAVVDPQALFDWPLQRHASRRARIRNGAAGCRAGLLQSAVRRRLPRRTLAATLQRLRRSSWRAGARREPPRGRRDQRQHRPRHRVLRADLRRPLFPAAASRRHRSRRYLPRRSAPRRRRWCSAARRIDGAVAPNGARYADLDQAFAYRDKTVPNCTCNGKDGLGLARIERPRDPTLRPGDIVATDDGPRHLQRQERDTARVHADQSVVRRMGAPAVRDQGAPCPAAGAGRDQRHRPPQTSQPKLPHQATVGLLNELLDHRVGERQRRRQPRRLDPEKMHEPRQPVLLRSFDHEIGGGLARPGQLRPDAGIVGLQ